MSPHSPQTPVSSSSTPDESVSHPNHVAKLSSSQIAHLEMPPKSSPIRPKPASPLRKVAPAPSSSLRHHQSSPIRHSQSSSIRHECASPLRTEPASPLCNSPLLSPIQRQSASPICNPWNIPARPNTNLPFIAFTPCDVDLVPKHTLNAKEILRLLQHYPDQQFPQMLAGIATYGARLGYEGTQTATIQLKNHKSAYSQPGILDESIDQDIALNRTSAANTIPNAYYISPLGLVPKTTARKITGWRKIHNLSAPRGRSVNDGIPKHYGTMVYETFQDALHLIAKSGRGTVLIKRDLKSAFRFIPVSPFDQWLLMYEWNGKVYYELFLPFGLRTAPIIFNLFSEAIHWIMMSLGWKLCHYMDDFLLVLPPQIGCDAPKAAAEFLHTCESVGFAIEEKKNREGTLVDFLGLEIDTMDMQARLPPDKHQHALQLVTDTLEKHSIPFYELERLLGFLSFCCAVLPLGRPFLRQVFNLLNRKTHHLAHVRVSSAAKRDLRWWKLFLHQWHGISVIRSLPRPVITIYTDASGTKGLGGIWGTQAFSVHVNRRHRGKHINWKEMFAIFFAVSLWADNWLGSRVVLMCDNSAVVDAINKKSMHGETIAILQLILLIAAIRDIELHAEWLPSEDNAIADALSRHQWDRLTVLCEQQGFSPTLLRNSSHLRNYRRKLLSSFGMDSPLPQESPTKPLSTTTKRLPPSNELATSTLLPSPLYLHGSQKQSSRPKRKQQNNTSKAYVATTSTWAMMPPHLMTHAWKGSSEEVNGTTAMPTNTTDFPLHERSLFKFSNSCPTRTMESTVKQPCVSASLRSYEQENLPMTIGKNLHRTFPSHGHPSLSKMATSSSPFPPPKQTISARVSEFPSPPHHLGRRHAQWLPPESSSIGSLQAPLPHCSQEHSAHSPEITLSKRSARRYSMQDSIPLGFLATPFEKALQSPLLPLAFPAMKSSCLGDGKAMPLTYISNINPNQYFNTPSPFIRHHSYLPPTSLASSRPSLQANVTSPAIPTMTWAV